MTGPQKMDKKEDKVTKKILNLTLEIIYLLTGENYKVVKKTSGDYVPTSSHSHVSKGWRRSQSPIMEPLPFSLILEESNGKKILEVTNRIIDLLMGEDDAVYFPMEEQGHCNLYKEAMMEDQPPETSVDLSKKRNPPERWPRPLYSQDSAQEELSKPQGGSVVVVKVEDEEAESVRGEEPSAEEEIFPQISTDGQYQRYTPDNHSDICPTHKMEDDLTSSEESLPNPTYHSRDLSPDPSEHRGCFSEHATPKRSLVAEKLFLQTQREAFISQQGSHTGEKPYSCSKCGKRFAWRKSLSIHEAVHLDVKPFSCSVCGKGFTQKSLLDRHEKVHTGERPFSCSECGKSFRQKSHFARHSRIHTGVKPFSCEVCGKCFTQKGDLVSHQRTHTGEKPYSCIECGARFSWKVQLIRHQGIHRPDTYF